MLSFLTSGEVVLESVSATLSVEVEDFSSFFTSDSVVDSVSFFMGSLPLSCLFKSFFCKSDKIRHIEPKMLFFLTSGEVVLESVSATLSVEVEDFSSFFYI